MLGCPCGCYSKPPFLFDPDCKRERTVTPRPRPPVVGIALRPPWALLRVTPAVDLDLLLLMFGLPRRWSSSGRGWLVPSAMIDDLAGYAEYRRYVVRYAR